MDVVKDVVFAMLINFEVNHFSGSRVHRVRLLLAAVSEYFR